jgi:plastocyanin
MRRGYLSVTIALALCAMAAPTHAATIQIVMRNLVISPAEVSAKVGDTIEWVNKDVFAHTATTGNGDFDVALQPNKSASLF